MSWYHESMYDRSRPVGSFWESDAPPLPSGVDQGALAADAQCDVAIIGGGYTGLSAALHLARDHGIDVCLLEAGPLGWGASGRNGGFCTFTPTGLSADALTKRYGLDETRRFITSQVEAVDLVRDIAASEAIDIGAQGEGTLEVAHAANRYADLVHEAEILSGQFGLPTRLLTREEMAETHYDSTEQFGALHLGVGFGLQPMRFVRGLAAAAARHGARLHGHSNVIARERDGAGHLLHCKGGTLRAKRVIIATNGFTHETLDKRLGRAIMPVISNIIVTRPLSQSELNAQKWQTETPCANTRSLLFYYRLLPDRRFLFGARGDMTGKPEDGAKMSRWMAKRLGEVFPAWADVPITHNWRGFVCMNMRQTPTIGQMPDDPTIWFGLGYHGDGVSAAPWTGRLLARLVAGQAKNDDIPVPLRGLPPRIPLSFLRRWYLLGALGYYRASDT